MARKSKGPKWYESKRSYFATVNGSTVNLGPDLEKATEKWSALVRQAKVNATGDSEPLENLVKKFLAYVEVEKRPETFRIYQALLLPFTSKEGTRNAADLKPFHVTEYIDEMRKSRTVGKRVVKWGTGSARMLVSVLKTAYAWGVSRGYLSVHPLRSLGRMHATARGDECVIKEEEYQLLLSQVPSALGDLLTMLWHTGSRPTALFLIEAKDVQGTRIVMQNRAGLKLKKIVLFLNPTAQQLVARLCALHPEGPVFRGSWGQRWTKDTVYKTLGFYKRRCGLHHVTPYSFRHAYAHRALRAGIPIAHIAKVMNTSVAHIERVYGHLSAATDVLQATVERL